VEDERHTGFGKVEAFFAEVGDQAEEGDEASQSGTNNVKVSDSKSRHFNIEYSRFVRFLIVKMMPEMCQFQFLALDCGHPK